MEKIRTGERGSDDLCVEHRTLDTHIEVIDTTRLQDLHRLRFSVRGQQFDFYGEEWVILSMKHFLYFAAGILFRQNMGAFSQNVALQEFFSFHTCLQDLLSKSPHPSPLKS